MRGKRPPRLRRFPDVAARRSRPTLEAMSPEAVSPAIRADLPVAQLGGATRARDSARESAAPPAFSELLSRELSRARAGVAELRVELGAIRERRVMGWPPTGGLDVASLSAASRAVAGAPPRGSPAAVSFGAGAGGPDPYGWRALSRDIGDAVVAPGFGALFERQIAQESGFDPRVAYGHRRSSAGAEGLAQLMPQYYPGVDRDDPQQSLVAGAQTMRHNLAAWDGDVRRALASYNAGLGRVRQLVEAHGDDWERGLPAETRRYLDAIVGSTHPSQLPADHPTVAVFGGFGPGGVLTSPLDAALARRADATGLALAGAAGAAVRAPADGRVVALGPLASLLGNGSSDAVGAGLLALTLDHGNGWSTLLAGLGDTTVAVGDRVQRGQGIGALGAGETLGLQLALDGRALDPRRYLLPS